MKQIDYDALQSKAIDWLRFPLIVCVVFIHSQGQPPLDEVVLEGSAFDGMMLYHALRIFLINSIASIAVPCFFTISGYYFFYHLKEWNGDTYKKKVQKRIYTLLIPYLIWNLMMFSYDVSLYFFRNIPFPLSLKDFLSAFWSHNKGCPINYPLWYVRDLMVLSVLSPVVYYLIRRLKAFYILIFFVLDAFEPWELVPGLSFTGFLYFGLGAYFSINRQNMLCFFRRYTWVITWITCFLLVAEFYLKVFSPLEIGWVHSAFLFFGVVFSLMMAGVLAERGFIKANVFSSQRVFFIFVFHALWLVTVPTDKVSEYMYTSFSGNAWMSFIVFLMIPWLKIIRFIPKSSW